MKNQIFRKGSWKTNIQGGLPKKKKGGGGGGGVWTISRFKGGIGKKMRVVFLSWGVDTPMHTMKLKIIIMYKF